jgi:hypothetical protein
MVTALVFVSVYALFAKSMRYDVEGRYEIIAAGLAQEGIEMIKNKRDANDMQWALWNASSGEQPTDSFVDIKGLTNCNPHLSLSGSDYQFSCSSDKKMHYSVNDKEYVTGAGVNGEPTFTRSCNTFEIGDNSLRVVCQVSWKSLAVKEEGTNNRKERSVKATLILTDWQR